MKEKLDNIKKQAEREIEEAFSEVSLEEVRIKYLGRKGELTEAMRGLKDLSLAEKREIGPVANEIKNELEELIEVKQKKIQGGEKRDFDYTRPGKRAKRGSLNPLTLAEEEIVDIFNSLNFRVVLGPEVESEWYNFDALNIPPNHPAREMWDTFWLKNGRQGKDKKDNQDLMRTHTSPVQIRFMRENKPPFQIIAPGRVFRYEATDASHEVNFYQVEGLMIGENINLAHFKKTVTDFLNKFFGRKLEFRFRPSYFPFVEPGVEVDIKMKKGGKWLEVMGAGMVHKQVLEAGGLDPKQWQGFAFGLGVDRLAMLKYEIPDIRLFYSGDLRFIKQF